MPPVCRQASICEGSMRRGKAPVPKGLVTGSRWPVACFALSRSCRGLSFCRATAQSLREDRGAGRRQARVPLRGRSPWALDVPFRPGPHLWAGASPRQLLGKVWADACTSRVQPGWWPAACSAAHSGPPAARGRRARGGEVLFSRALGCFEEKPSVCPVHTQWC